MNNSKVSVPQIIILAAGAVMLIGSFLDFYKHGSSAWGSGGFLIVTLAPLLGIIMAVVIALTAFANVKLPETVLGFTWKQIHLVLAIYAVLLMLGWLIFKFPSGLSPDKAIGFWLLLLGSIALIVGAVMLQKDETTATAAGPGTTPPTPF